MTARTTAGRRAERMICLLPAAVWLDAEVVIAHAERAGDPLTEHDARRVMRKLRTRGWVVSRRDPTDPTREQWSVTPTGRDWAMRHRDKVLPVPA